VTTYTLPDHGFQHELVLHAGTAALIDLMIPYVRAGAAAGEPIIVVGEPQFVDEMLAAVPDVPDIRAVPESGRARFPGRDLRQFQQILSSLDTAESRVRVVNQMPTMTNHEWHEWRRYEAAANYVLAPFRVWGTCAYDTDRLDEAMLDDLIASHPHVHTVNGRRPSEPFATLDHHIRGYLDLPPHPIERTPPQLSLIDPSAPTARRAILDLGTVLALPPAAIKAAALAVSETVTNGSVHGKTPVRLNAWTDGGRLTVSVSDAGTGPHPLVGLRPAPVDSLSGRGMWILHQLLADLHHRTDRHGYTVRFSVGHETTIHP
jgi:anti-sigma regulatory factor (Ser/Thr protein kinase)